MATKTTVSLTKRAAGVYDGCVHCLLGHGSTRTYAWLPDKVQLGQTITIDRVPWLVLEIFRASTEPAGCER